MVSMEEEGQKEGGGARVEKWAVTWVRAAGEVVQARRFRGQRMEGVSFGFWLWVRLLAVCGLVCRRRASRAQVRQRVAEVGAWRDWASHLGLNSKTRSFVWPRLWVVSCSGLALGLWVVGGHVCREGLHGR